MEYDRLIKEKLNELRKQNNLDIAELKAKASHKTSSSEREQKRFVQWNHFVNRIMASDRLAADDDPISGQVE